MIISTLVIDLQVIFKTPLNMLVNYFSLFFHWNCIYVLIFFIENLPWRSNKNKNNKLWSSMLYILYTWYIEYGISYKISVITVVIFSVVIQINKTINNSIKCLLILLFVIIWFVSFYVSTSVGIWFTKLYLQHKKYSE